MSQNSNEPRESLAPRVREDQAAGGSRSVVNATAGDPPRVPGGWPVSHRAVRLREQWQSERARRQLVLDSIRAHLGEQPSPRTIRSCARRWANDINHIADQIITARNDAESTP